uniref:Ig-like domain-containing protein n=1 Tax=Esox lucius TaxID=8010 RepID=A0AAY5JXH9_ESOLU
RVRGETTTQEILNPDGTITVRSDFILVPSRSTHLETLTCITSYNDETNAESVTLDIQYEPEVSVEGFDGNWYLDRQNVQLACLADANPPASLFQWRRLNGSIPSSVEIRDNILLFKGPIRYEVGGIYVCDATNSIGTSSAFVEVSITEEPLPQLETGDVISVLGVILAAGLILGVAYTLLLLNRRKQRKTDADVIQLRKKLGDNCKIIRFSGFTIHRTGSSPSLKMGPHSARTKFADDFQRSGRIFEELPNTADYVSYRLACNKEDYPEPYSPPINPPLSFLPQHHYSSSPSKNSFSHLSHQFTSNNTFSAPSHPPPSKNTFSPPSNPCPVFRYPSLPSLCHPTGAASYTFPKEQYV